ncbi:MAG: ABC transporter substrate-binding protein [Gemmatimonadota bacterium]|nr:ABC transporter substrate-binding protein [Gemmatimonadota bacterium]
MRRRWCLLFSGAAWLASPGCAREAKPARSFVAAVTTDPGHLNTAITTNGSVHTAGGLLYDGLVELNDELEPVPALAERWDVDSAGTRYRFHLRRDVRWHDGQPLHAADVKFTFEQLLLRFHSRTRASLAPVLDRIETPDDFTVEFIFRRPYAALLQQLNVEEAPIMPQHLFRTGDPLRNPANTAPVGTGPYRFVSYSPGSEIRFIANKEYFRGQPAIREIVLRIVPNPTVQVLALEAGEVDWLFGVPGPDRARLRQDKRFTVVQTPGYSGGSNCISTVGFNLDKPLFRDIRVRRAIAHSVDRDQVLERVLFGEGRVADAPISSGIAFAHAAGLAMPAFDTARAAGLLDNAGWRRTGKEFRTARGVDGVPDGTALTIRFTAMPGQAAYGDLLRAQLRAVGIDLRVTALEPAVFSQTVFTARDFDTAIISYCNGTDPEIGVRRQYVSASIGPVPFSNTAGYRNQEMDGLFDSAASALDAGVRTRLYRRIQEIAVRDQPYVWLVETLNTRAFSARCTGFGISPHFAATAHCRN